MYSCLFLLLLFFVLFFVVIVVFLFCCCLFVCLFFVCLFFVFLGGGGVDYFKSMFLNKHSLYFQFQVTIMLHMTTNEISNIAWWRQQENDIATPRIRYKMNTLKTLAG